MFPRSFVTAMAAKIPSFRKKKRKKPKKGVADFWAIKGSWFSIKENNIFCLLGPNGAGKTTTINCLTGVLPPTGGDALIHGESIVATGGMDRIRASMGVCPQFDVLWKELTGMEHMKDLRPDKGLSRQEVIKQTEDLIESVKLTPAANIRSGAYSGGHASPPVRRHLPAGRPAGRVPGRADPRVMDPISRTPRLGHHRGGQEGPSRRADHAQYGRGGYPG